MIGSLRFRLLVSAITGVTVSLYLLGMIIVHMFADYAETDFYDDLEGFEQEIVASLSSHDAAENPVVTLLHPQFSKTNSGYYWQASDDHGLVLRSQSLGDTLIQAPLDQVAPGTLHHHRLRGPDGRRVLAVEGLVQPPGSTAPLRVLVAMNSQWVDASTKLFRTTVIASLLILGGGLIGASWLQVWVGLRPLKSLRNRLTEVREGRALRMDGDFPSEVSPLVEDLNTLLGHQAEVVQRGRVLAGNLAHGLKTPLAVLSNEAAHLAENGQSDAAQKIQTQIARMLRLVDYHTARARAAAARGVPGLRCSVAESVASLSRAITCLHRDKNLSLTTEGLEPLLFCGDQQDLEEMLGNLMDNAAKWADSKILVRGHHTQGSCMLLWIEDDGPGIPDHLRDEAFARGRRLDDSVPGSGLGLAIVRDLAEMYGGSVDLNPSSLGGLSVQLRLPAAQI